MKLFVAFVALVSSASINEGQNLKKNIESENDGIDYFFRNCCNVYAM